MDTLKTDLFLHPVRMRIILTLVDSAMSPREIAAALPDVAQATLYRHINILADGGLLVVAEERQVRSVTEKVYTLIEGGGIIPPEAFATATPEDHLRYFTVFVSALLADFARCVGREDFDIVADMVGYRQVPLQMSDEELHELAAQINELIKPHLTNEPGPGRRRRLFSTILMPGDGPELPEK